VIAAERPRRLRAIRPSRLALRRIAGWVALGAGAGWVIADAWGAGIGAALGVAAARWLPRPVSPEVRAVRARANADLPFAADLMAAALQAGATPEGAVRLVGQAIAGPLGLRLSRVERALRLGAPAVEAWGYLGDVEGAARVLRAADRSGHSGAGFAGALHRVAEDLRADRLLAAEAAARRAGVLIVLPLGLCFLPAFVLTGLGPVIVAVLGGVLATP
jgi:Type II secretion system (T2SS), protein F